MFSTLISVALCFLDIKLICFTFISQFKIRIFIIAVSKTRFVVNWTSFLPRKNGHCILWKWLVDMWMIWSGIGLLGQRWAFSLGYRLSPLNYFSCVLQMSNGSRSPMCNAMWMPTGGINLYIVISGGAWIVRDHTGSVLICFMEGKRSLLHSLAMIASFYQCYHRLHSFRSHSCSGSN